MFGVGGFVIARVLAVNTAVILDFFTACSRCSQYTSGTSQEASARTLVVLDVEGWKYQFNVKDTRSHSDFFFGSLLLSSSKLNSSAVFTLNDLLDKAVAGVFPSHPPVLAFTFYRA